RMSAGAVSEQFHERSAQSAASPFQGPLRCSRYGEEVVAVDLKAGQAVTERFRGKALNLTRGDSGERRDGPLIVDDAQDHGCAKGAGECQCFMEVALSRGTFPNMSDGDVAIALVGGR